MLKMWGGSVTPTIAIDPGSARSAAVAMIDSNGRLSVSWGFETLREVASAISREIKKYGPATPIRFVVEFVHARPGQGVTSMFTFGRGTGVGFGALFALRPDCPVYEVTPQKWQGSYISTPPFDSTIVAQTIFSQDDLQQCRQPRGKLNHNACDAALIAYWAANQDQSALKVSEHYQTPASRPSKRKAR